MRKAYVATVQLLVLADEAEEASDLIFGLLESPEASFILDWGYPRFGGQRLYPALWGWGVVDPDQYEAGSFLS